MNKYSKEKLSDSNKELTNRQLDHLKVQATKHVDDIDKSIVLFSSFIGILLTIEIGWLINPIMFGILSYLTTYLIAPSLANVILQQRVSIYVKRNYEVMADKGEGFIEFFLYNHRYEVSWELHERPVNTDAEK